MTGMITKILMTTSFLAAVSLPAIASTPLAKKADTNKDGLISQAEFLSLSDQKFAKTDTDANGLLTPEERKAHRAQMREKRAQARFTKTDTNGDGQISNEEYNAARALRKQKMKRRMDVNGDGVVDAEDKKARKAKRQERRAKRQEKRQEKRQKTRRDANGDGMIDLTEYRTAASAIFTRMDKDGDGMLNKSEQRRPKNRRKKRDRMRR
ncbi:MAG: EF-hand domain-containing protein [Robiginitomaculum sp.]|nr:EF-hand domain-containing protein [Robiginitomaculum sp.]